MGPTGHPGLDPFYMVGEDWELAVHRLYSTLQFSVAGQINAMHPQRREKQDKTVEFITKSFYSKSVT